MNALYRPEPGKLKKCLKISPNQNPPPLIVGEEKQELLKKLNPVEYQVTQQKTTERPYSNRYYKHWEKGVYSCVVCNEPLFLSSTKYDSKSGWPAFYDIIDETKVRYKQDLSHVGANLLLIVCNPSLARTEVGCAVCGAHVGHVFDDGPKPTGRRFCVNSNSLAFSDGKPTEHEVPVTSSAQAKHVHFKDTVDEPIVYEASPSNSCSLGTSMCFRVASSEPPPAA